MTTYKVYYLYERRIDSPTILFGKVSLLSGGMLFIIENQIVKFSSRTNIRMAFHFSNKNVNFVSNHGRGRKFQSKNLNKQIRITHSN